MKLHTFFLALSILIISGCNNNTNNQPKAEESPVKGLTAFTFKTKVFDFEDQQNYTFKGTKPCIVDFYATWCGPCKRLAPILDELALTYKGQIDFYRVDTDMEQNLSAMMGVQGLPSLYFFPTNNVKPFKLEGFKSKEELIDAINQLLKASKTNATK